MAKILVAGGAGFIGSHVVDKLVEENNEVIVLDNLSSGDKKNLNEKTKFYEIDIRDKKIKEIFEKEKPDYVLHLAAQINLRESIKDPLNDAEINILGSINILNNCVKAGVKKIIFSSTGGAIYGDESTMPTPETEKENPISPYGISKLCIENYLKFYKKVNNLDYVSLRYSNVYGPRQNSKGEAGVVSIFIDKILEEKQIVINGSGEQTRDYTYVKDVADANYLALNLSGIFNVSTGKETSVNELFGKITKIMGVSIEKKHGEKIKGEQMRSCLDSRKLIEKSWGPKYDLNQGLKETVEWFKEK